MFGRCTTCIEKEASDDFRAVGLKLGRTVGVQEGFMIFLEGLER